jgi:SAM-dependent methyltransferase
VDNSGVTLNEERATSFGSVAESYDRVRPSPPPEALDWLLPADCAVAVDLGAGTGLFTRALQRRVEHVVAVEPDARMRDVLAARSPATRVLAGRAEEIPLPDGYADAVLVSTAWHWFDLGLAVPEIARVLKDGGRLGVLWTSRDRAEEWVARLEVIGPGARTPQDVRERLHREHTVILPEQAEFGPLETASFGFTRRISVADALDWLATSSRVIVSDPAEREAGLAKARTALLARAGVGEMVEMPVRSWCWRADRLARASS